jgi:hypothetical protein
VGCVGLLLLLLLLLLLYGVPSAALTPLTLH